MKVYFAPPKNKQNKFALYYPVVEKTLEECGYKNIVPSGKELSYQKMMKLLKESDANLFDCSTPDSLTGFQISKSLEFNKPTIVLYHESSPECITSIDEEKLLPGAFKNKEGLKTILLSLLKKARMLADKRFNFFITPSLLNFLNLMSHEYGMTKSTYLRNLIIEDKKKRRIDD